jgi:hypothetical protein
MYAIKPPFSTVSRVAYLSKWWLAGSRLLKNLLMSAKAAGYFLMSSMNF